MQHLSILLPEGQSNVSSLAGTQEIFMAANSHWKKKGNDPRFKIEIVGVSKSVKLNSDQFRIEPDATITQVKKTNLIIIPSFNHNYQPTRRNNNQQLTGWIRKQYNEGAEVASMCTGAFLLAETGLLDGRKCSTHWSVADKFRNLFPQINLQADFLITDEDGLYTNGGAYSFLNLVIYQVEISSHFFPPGSLMLLYPFQNLRGTINLRY
jgi:transcriptional regulator GlxA family with amidase domain